MLICSSNGTRHKYSITTVVINGPMVERCFPSWETDNAVIVKQNKTTHSSTWGPCDLCEICISIGAFTRTDLLCKVAMMQQKELGQPVTRMAFGGWNVARHLAFVNTLDKGGLSRAIPFPLVLRQMKPSDTDNLNIQTLNGLKDPAQKRRSTLNCISNILWIIRDKFDKIFMHRFRFASGARA